MDGFHRIPPRIHMITVCILPEILIQRKLGIRALRSLKYDFSIFVIQMIYFFKIGFFRLTMFCQKLILTLPAHGHDLLEQFTDTMF